MANQNPTYTSTSPEFQLYYDSLLKSHQVPGSVKFINQQKGRGLFAEKPIQKDEVVFRERPIVAMQHIDNRASAWSCSYCFKFLGSLEDQFRRHQLVLLQLEQSDVMPLDQESSPFTNINKLDKTQTNLFECTGGCGEHYCSEQCRNESWQRHHRILCVGPITDPHHPLLLFKQHAIVHHELFLLGAQAIAHIISTWQSNGGDFQQAVLPFATFVRRWWWEVAAVDSDIPVNELKKMIDESFKYLSAALLPHVLNHPLYLTQQQQQQQQGTKGILPIMQLFSMEFYSMLMGLLELNDNGIEIKSPLQEYLQQLPNLIPEEREKVWAVMQPTVEQIMNVMDEEEEEEMDMDDDHDDHDNCHHEHGKEEEGEEKTGLEKALGKNYVFPPFDGLGLYPIAAVMNHSCVPNTIVKFHQDNTAFVHAKGDVPTGAELTHSYIEEDESYEDREDGLAAYGFQCDCIKCLSERNQH